jgi:hypothetical protein
MSKNQLSIILFSILISFSIISCDKFEEVLPEKPAEIPSTTYIIKKGQHSSASKYSPLDVSKMTFTVTFDSSAIYQTKNSSNQADINKLYGLSDCGSHHHQNSARFGWRWRNDQLEIHAYSYNSGQRKSTFITSVAFNKKYVYELELTEDKYIFSVDGKIISLKRSCSGNSSGYKLFPYFGGDEKAPHDIKIVIADLPSTN